MLMIEDYLYKLVIRSNRLLTVVCIMRAQCVLYLAFVV